MQAHAGSNSGVLIFLPEDPQSRQATSIWSISDLEGELLEQLSSGKTHLPQRDQNSGHQKSPKYQLRVNAPGPSVNSLKKTTTLGWLDPQKTAGFGIHLFVKHDLDKDPAGIHDLSASRPL